MLAAWALIVAAGFPDDLSRWAPFVDSDRTGLRSP